MRALIVAAMVGLAGVVFASQAPTESAKQNTQQSQPPAAPLKDSAQSPTVIVNVSPSQTDQISPEKGAQKANKDNAPDWALVDVTIALAIIAAFQLLLFLWQLRIMQGSLKDTADAAKATQAIATSMDDTAKKQLRAYVGLQTEDGPRIHISHHLGVVGLETHPAIFNRGFTPAKNLTVESEMRILPFPLPSDFRYPIPSKANLSKITLSRDQYQRLYCIVLPRITEEVFIDLKNTVDARCFLYGTIHYEDIYEVAQHTNFCFSAIWSDDGNGCDWFAYHDHNDAT